MIKNKHKQKIINNRKIIQDKKVIIFSLIAIITLLLMVISASYAYFNVTGTSNTNTSTISTLTGSVGSIVMTSPTPNLHINLNTTNMQSGNDHAILYATNTVADYDENSTPRSIGTITVVGGDTDVNYSCTFDLNISLSGTMVDYLQSGDAKLVLTGIHEEVIDLTDISSPITISVNSLSGSHREVSLLGVLQFYNKTSNQNYLKGKTLEVELENTNLNCDIQDGGFTLAYKSFNGSEYVPANMQLFSEENYLKDFELGFTIDYINPNRFRSGQVDTVFNSLYEETPWPGITFRIQNSKWFFQVGNGVASKKLTFEPNAIQTFKVMRINNIVYYSINNGEPIMVMDLTGLTQTFDTPLTFGVSLDSNNNPMAQRYLMAEVSNMYAKFLESGSSNISMYDYYDSLIDDFVGTELTPVFTSNDSHLFNGKAETAINSNVALFSTANYQKDFVATLYLEAVDIQAQTKTQATLFNAKNEADSNGPGIVFRKNTNTQYELKLRNSDGTNSTIYLSPTVKRVNIIRKRMKMYYQVDFDEILPLGTYNDLSDFDINSCFDISTTFGSNINSKGAIDRVIVGVMSGMKIKMES